jgi:hypothetical protein
MSKPGPVALAFIEHPLAILRTAGAGAGAAVIGGDVITSYVHH